MFDPPKFPHLKWTYQGPFDAGFDSRSFEQNSEVKAAKADPSAHSSKIRDQLNELRGLSEKTQDERRTRGLPDLKGKGFLLRVPEDTDPDELAYYLGVELVSETPNGLMFVATDDLNLEKMERVLSLFSENTVGGGKASEILEVFDSNDDRRKLDELLVGRVREAWPFKDEEIYTFDVGVQTATSTRNVKWTRLQQKKKDQTEEERARINEERRNEDMWKAEEKWMDAALIRFGELEEFISPYGGNILSGPSYGDATSTPTGIIFPDSIQSRIRMSGMGFSDLVRNFPHLFEVSWPPEILFLPGSPEMEGGDGDLTVFSPDAGAPAVCVIDSGMQENHRWLEPAIDKNSSRCFVPELEPTDIADEVYPRGHGTRVAGAVLFPREVPKSGNVEPVAWIQNARVLDAKCNLPISLPPERYLTEVVAHFSVGERPTKIFNHSIADLKPCDGQRMCAWAAKVDDLVHRHDLLFIQVSGNFEPIEVFNALQECEGHPDQLLTDAAKVASPGQSMHALTVGSIAHDVFSGGDLRSFADYVDHPSVFSRSGYSPLWRIVKPEVVEYGGDRLYGNPLSRSMPTNSSVATELLASSLHGAPAISSDEVGTSFAAPKVAHIAAHLQRLFPEASSQLYRALVVQSARWPAWAEAESDSDKVLRLIGYGLPSLERATENSPYRVTLFTDLSQEIRTKEYHLYQIAIPESIRGAAKEGGVRVDVTLAYTASPRRTRSRRNGYLETWLDWRAICKGEPLEHFKERMEGRRTRYYTGYPWKIHEKSQHGDVEIHRDRGSVQKDWTVIEANELPEDFAIAVRAHVGWNHQNGGGRARYSLVVTFESLDVDLPVYSSIEAEIFGEIRTSAEIETLN